MLRRLYRFFWVRYRSCWRKVAHSHESSAVREAKRMRDGVRAYHCPYCRKWHVGHSSW